MIVSASRRTDIPALYADWFVRRMMAGYACVANPYNASQVRRVSLAPEDVDAFVFWSKNPAPLFERAAVFVDRPWVLQYTLNAYLGRIEPRIPPLERRIECFASISDRYGAERMNWRYDPILLAEGIDARYHMLKFEGIASALENRAHRCTISFIDAYAGMDKRMAGHSPLPMEENQMRDLAGNLSRIGAKYGIALNACAEPLNFSKENVGRGHCIDAAQIARIAGRPVRAKPDKNQWPGCGCAESIDIGRYGTCTNGCVYCYAVKGREGKLSAADGDRL